MLIHHVNDRLDEGSIKDVFRKRHARGCDSARGILDLLDLLEQQPCDVPLWAYEGHSHLVLTLSRTSGSPYVSVVCAETDMFTVHGIVQRPVTSIKRAGEVYFGGLRIGDAVDVVIQLLNSKIQDDIERGVRSADK